MMSPCASLCNTYMSRRPAAHVGYLAAWTTNESASAKTKHKALYNHVVVSGTVILKNLSPSSFLALETHFEP